MSESTVEMPNASITDEMIDDMKRRIGRELNIQDSINNEEVTRLAILRFCNGIGDTNPLFVDPDYAKGTRYGGLVAPPSFVMCCFSGLQFGWPGLGAFHSATNIDFFRPMRPGERVLPTAIYDGFDGPTSSNFAGRRVTDKFHFDYRDENGELIARSGCEVVHFERGSAQKRAAERKFELPHPWTDSELEAIDKQILAESPRGGIPRYWEDVEVGDEIDTLTKGPIGMTDEVAFVASGATPIPRLAAHRASLQQYEARPAWAFRDPHTKALEPIYAVHYNDQAAHAMGVAMSYDVGVQRHCWQLQLLTDWMGDDAWLKRSTMQLRGFVFLSDVISLGGRVIGKRVDDDGEHVVEIETWSRNQRGLDVMPGTGIIALPSRDAGVFPVDARVSRV